MPRETPVPTPLPRTDDTGEHSYPCPYRDEILLVRRLRGHGVEEQVVIGGRREKLSIWLAGIALSAVMALGSWVITSGVTLARDVGRAEVRVEQLERASSAQSTSAVQLGRLESRIDGFERRLDERLGGIEQRLDRAEASRPAQLRRQ